MTALQRQQSPMLSTESIPPERLQNKHAASSYHLMWQTGEVLCGVDPNPRVWVWPWTDYMLTWPEACSACVDAYRHPHQRFAA